MRIKFQSQRGTEQYNLEGSAGGKQSPVIVHPSRREGAEKLFHGRLIQPLKKGIAKGVKGHQTGRENRPKTGKPKRRGLDRI